MRWWMRILVIVVVVVAVQALARWISDDPAMFVAGLALIGIVDLLLEREV